MRWRLLARVEQRFEPVIAILGLGWLALFVVGMVHGLDPLLTGLTTIIWIIFILDFLVRLLIAPHRLRYLEHNWLTALSLIVPALRIARLAAILRALRVAPALPGVRLVRAVGSLNRGMHALARTMHRRGVSYVIVLTVAVTFAGAAGMYALEPHAANGNGFTSYGDAVWWTAMIITTIGSAYWPRTPEGRILAFLISLYSIGVFGFITATLASFFVDRDATTSNSGASSTADVDRVLREVCALRTELRAALGATAVSPRGPAGEPPQDGAAAP
jgi:voltage-gated potassium channel